MPTNLHILSMLIQNADRTTYGINKIVVFVLAFVVFFVVGFVSWQWDGVAPEPWRLRTLVLTPLTMSLLLYVCCDQFGVYYRCQTLWESIRRFVVAYACFVALSVMIWKFFVPFSADVGVQSLAYLLTFLGSLWLRISRFRAEKGWWRKPYAGGGNSGSCERIPQDVGEQSCGLQEWVAGHGA